MRCVSLTVCRFLIFCVPVFLCECTGATDCWIDVFCRVYDFVFLFSISISISISFSFSFSFGFGFGFGFCVRGRVATTRN